jgi:hypothetical protein
MTHCRSDRDLGFAIAFTATPTTQLSEKPMCDKHAPIKRQLQREYFRLDDFRPLTEDKTFHALLDAASEMYERAIAHLDQVSQRRPGDCICVDELKGQWSTPAVGHPAMEAARDQCKTFREELWIKSSAAVDCMERAWCFINAAIKTLVELELSDRIEAITKEPTPSTEKVGTSS